MSALGVALMSCVQLLPAQWQGREFTQLDAQVPAGFWVGQASPPDWAAAQGGWAHQGCFLTRSSVEGLEFWLLSNGVDL